MCTIASIPGPFVSFRNTAACTVLPLITSGGSEIGPLVAFSPSAQKGYVGLNFLETLLVTLLLFRRMFGVETRRNPPIELWQCKRKQRRPSRNCHVLLPIHSKRHRRRIHRAAHLKMPQRLSRSRV
jgi:hypothetical protein